MQVLELAGRALEDQVSESGHAQVGATLILAVLANHLQGTLRDQWCLQHNLGEDPTREGRTGTSCIPGKGNRK